MGAAGACAPPVAGRGAADPLLDLVHVLSLALDARAEAVDPAAHRTDGEGLEGKRKPAFFPRAADCVHWQAQGGTKSEPGGARRREHARLRRVTSKART